MNNTPELPSGKPSDTSLQQQIGDNSGLVAGEAQTVSQTIYNNCSFTCPVQKDEKNKDAHFQPRNSLGLEENTSSDHLKGGSHEKSSVFVSYIDKDEDKKWVENKFIPALKKRGVSIISSGKFNLGVPRLENIERAIKDSDYVVAVVSKSYIKDGFANFENVLAQHYGCEKQEYPLILVLRDASQPRLRLQPITPLDMSDEDRFLESIDRLVEVVSQPVQKYF